MRAIWSADSVGKVASGRSTRSCGVDMGPDSERVPAPTLARLGPGVAASLGARGRDPDVQHANREPARAPAVLHLAAHSHAAAGDGVDCLPHELLLFADD